MKYNIIGDIHGRTIWKELVREDYINIFVGDYFSPYDRIDFEDLKKCFLDIVQYKKDHPETILLLGNHDEDHWHIHEIYSRFDSYHFSDIKRLFEDNKEYFQIAYSIENKILVTHAGVSVVWYEQCINNNKYARLDTYDDDDLAKLAKSPDEAYVLLQKILSKQVFNYSSSTPSLLEWNNKLWRYKGSSFEEIRETPDDIAKAINDRWLKGQYRIFNFRDNSQRGDYYGDASTHSPLWIRPYSLRFNSIFRYSEFQQVVGHTQMEEITNSDGIYYIDVLGNNPSSLIIEIDGNDVRYEINDLKKAK